MKERLVNIRPLFVVWLSMMLGILTFYCFTNVINLGTSYFWLVILLVVEVAVIVLFVLSFVKNDKLKFVAKYKWLYLVSIISMLVPLVLFSVKYSNYKKYPYLSGEVDIVGRVVACNIANENATIVLSDCNVGEDMESVSSITLYVTKQITPIEVGTILSAKATIRTTKLFTDENNIGKYNKDKVYSAYCTTSDIYTVGKDDMTVPETIRESVKDVLHDHLNKDNADVAYAMLFGDKSAMSYEVYEAFSFAGVSHMLAVSGLHVGFLVAFMTFILSLFRVPEKANIVIVSVVLIFYCVLCDFTASVVRATVMAIVLMLGNLLGAQHDNLSSLSLAGIVILLFNPLQLFDYGFQLSFMCVLAMITLNKYVARGLIKIKIPRPLATAFAVSLSVNIALIPLTSKLFGTINVVGIISNLFLVPIFSIAFPLLFYCALISAGLNFLGFTLFVPNVLLHIVRLSCDIVTEHFSQIAVFDVGYGVIVTMILFLLALKFLMLRLKAKTILLGIIVATMVGLSVVGFVPKTYSSNKLLTWGQYDTNCAIITTRSGEKILFDYDEYHLKMYALKYKINKFDSWVLPTFTLTKIDDTIKTIKKYKIDTLYIKNYEHLNDYSLAKVCKICKIEYIDDDFTQAKGFDIQMFSTENRVYGVLIRTNKTLLFDMGMTSNQMAELEDKLTQNINYCITKSAKYDTDTDLSIIRDVICTTDAEKKDIKSIADSSSFVLQL